MKSFWFKYKHAQIPYHLVGKVSLPHTLFTLAYDFSNKFARSKHVIAERFSAITNEKTLSKKRIQMACVMKKVGKNIERSTNKGRVMG